MSKMPPPRSSERNLDLICMGRAAVDLYGEQLGVGLEEVQSFAKSLGGCAANIAVGTARQGLRVAMLSRVGDEQMGRFVRDTLEQEGVETSRVRTDPERLTGLVFLSIRDHEDFPLLFYRERCADMALGPEDFDADFIGRARALLLTGTHFSESRVADASRAALGHALAQKTAIVLDIDFRPVLWGLAGHRAGAERFVPSERATRVFDEVLPHCDLVVGTEDELRLAGGHHHLETALDTVLAKTSGLVVLKRGAQGCTVFAEGGRSVYECSPFPVETYNVLGAGDAFMAGFLRAWLEARPLAECGRTGNAAGALVVGRHGCAPAMPSRVELDRLLLDHPAPPGVGRPRAVADDPEWTRCHRVSLRRAPPDELCVLAFDHRAFFATHAPGAPERLLALKLLIAEGGVRGAEARGLENLGMIIDAEGGRAALAAMTRKGSVWLARPIERPDYRPLAFEGGLENVDARLRTWPQRHVVKCLVQYHPDGNPELRATQKRRLLRLQEACIRLERALLLEVLPMRTAGAGPDAAAVPRALERLYKAGLYPDWWKLPPHHGSTWARIDAVIARYEHRCQGVLVLGLEADRDALSEAFQVARAESRYVRGFAVGRTIFSEPARLWLRGDLNDDGVAASVARRFADIIDAWRDAGTGGSS